MNNMTKTSFCKLACLLCILIASIYKNGFCASPPLASGLDAQQTLSQTKDNSQRVIQQNTIQLEPFGNNLFQGAFSSKYEQGLNPNYIITEGDRISIRAWGAKSFEAIFTVDSQGNIFIPEIGPVHVDGVSNKDLNGIVQKHVNKVFSNNIEIYVNLLGVQPIGVFVTGYVQKPGRYAGNMVDSILYYIDQAGGIVDSIGSYRRIAVLRNGNEILSIDLYDFILNGKLAYLQLQDGDTILVKEAISRIAVEGTISDPAIYEFLDTEIHGKEVVKLAKLLPVTSHVLIEGVRQGQPISWYASLSEFQDFILVNGDKITFFEDIKGDTITIRISGSHEGPSAMAIKKDAKILEVLSYIKIDPAIADLNSIYLKRVRVAKQQKEALQSSLRQLEKSVLTASSASAEEATIRRNEADLILRFVEKAQQAQPEGRVVIMTEGKLSNISLEDKDEIVIQQKSDVVAINGEVLLPQAIIFKNNTKAEDYIRLAGGFTDRADKGKVLVIRANGETEVGRSVLIKTGDQILVLPRAEMKTMQFAKDITQILYQIAVATKVAVGL